MKTFAHMIDPSHGWLRVPTVEFNKYPDIHSQVSEYSYRSDKHVFLEQDVDMDLFIAARTAAGIETKLAEYSNKSRQSKIRKYPAYMPHADRALYATAVRSSASPITPAIMATLESNRKAVHILGDAA